MFAASHGAIIFRENKSIVSNAKTANSRRAKSMSGRARWVQEFLDLDPTD